MTVLTALMRNIDYQFQDPQLLKMALTHRSRGAQNYERLEFLGDSILGFVVAEWLFKQYPKLGEGKLSRMRASLVRKETLAGIARYLELSDFLILGEGELKSGGFNRDSILADTVESIIGAIYFDSGFSSAKAFIFRYFEQQFGSISANANFKDAKSRLQEHMQKRGHNLPEYNIVEVQGEQHEQVFTVLCILNSLDLSAEATAKSRRLADQKSATKLLEQLESETV